jgi:hypothetical protein
VRSKRPRKNSREKAQEEAQWNMLCIPRAEKTGGRSQ